MSTREIHPLAGKTVTLKLAGKDVDGIDGVDFRVEDWAQNVWAGTSWMFMDGNPAALKYAVRSGFSGLPIDDEVVYGKVGGLGHCVHNSELQE